MYLFFLIFLIFISICLNGLILLQPGKSASDMMHPSTFSNIQLFNSFRSNNFITNIVGLCACLFLIVSLILCNINDKKINSSLLENHTNDFLNEKSLNVQNHILSTKIPR